MADYGIWYFLACLVFIAAGAALSKIDIREKRLPNKILWPATGLIALLLLVQAATSNQWPAMQGAAWAAGLSFLGYAVLRFMSPASLGFGDVKLSISIGLLLGWQSWQDAVLGAMLAFVLGGVFSVFALLSKKITLKSHVAFGPFMVIAGWIMLFI